MFSPSDEINPHEVMTALRRRKAWVLGGLLLGLAFGVGIKGVDSIKPKPKAEIQIKLLVNTGLEPCNPSKKTGFCKTNKLSVDIASSQLDVLASKKFSNYTIEPLNYGKNMKSKTSVQLVATSSASEQDLKEMMSELVYEYRNEVLKRLNKENDKSLDYSGWMEVYPTTRVSVTDSNQYILATSLISGLILGVGAALLADRKANRVYSNSLILNLLGYPIRLILPSLPWSASEVNPLIGQLASQMDPSLDWHLLSIAHNHKAVPLLARTLREQETSVLSCNVAGPLLATKLEFNSSARPKAILVVVESGFNSAQGLEQARLMLTQMSNVKEVGVVLIGVPVPQELMASQTT